MEFEAEVQNTLQKIKRN